MWRYASAVATETMLRVAKNIDTVAGRLRALGYRFADPAEVHRLPTRQAAARLDAFEVRHGPLPLSLRSFYDVTASTSSTTSASPSRAAGSGADPTPTKNEPGRYYPTSASLRSLPKGSCASEHRPHQTSSFDGQCGARQAATVPARIDCHTAERVRLARRNLRMEPPLGAPGAA